MPAKKKKELPPISNNYPIQQLTHMQSSGRVTNQLSFNLSHLEFR